MHIKNRFLKTILKLVITVSVIECLYLIALPFSLEKFVNSDCAKKLIKNSKINANIGYKNVKFKTHLKPDLTFSADEILIKEKDTDKIFLQTNNINTKISLFDLIFKKINIKHSYIDNLILNLVKDENNQFNFEKMLPTKKGSKAFSLKTNRNILNINHSTINLNDNYIKTNSTANINSLILNIDKEKNVTLQTQGEITNNKNKTEFDINVALTLPINQGINSNLIQGNCFIYNLDLDQFAPYIKKYGNNNIKKLEGFFDYIQLSTIKEAENRNQIVLNTKFKDFEFDYNGWENHIIAKDEHCINSNLELEKNTIFINSFTYKADKINAKTNGKIIIEKGKNPFLDLEVEANNTKAEKVAPILPPNLPPEYRTLEKVKRYNVHGDIEGKLKIYGYAPHPDLTGYVKGKNVHILDKPMHKLHKGTVSLTFDKRILNMDILVEMLENQRATIKGHTYMYREGVNNVSIKTTNNIDYPLAQKIVLPVSKVFNFQLGPIPEMNITSGKGIIDVNIQGSIDFVKLKGYAEFDNAKLTYNGLYGEVYGGKGRLDFEDDTISFKSEKAFVKTNPLSIDGKVKLNNHLNFNISSERAQADDLLEIINKSFLLKDVKEGLKIITGAKGNTKLKVNMRANIVPVPFGQPPLPPEEAFKDMKVNGSVYLFGNSCYIEGFKTPIEQVKGIVDFTETETTIQEINGISGTSPIKLTGKIINDLETKIPYVDILLTSNNVNLKDSIRFLTQSYLYPENYPNLSSLYNIASKHDLYFKYQAKSIDFLTDKAYAVMNFIPDNSDNPIKAKSGKVIMDKAKVIVDSIEANLFDSSLFIDGEVLHVDTLNPIYNLKIKSDNINLENLNDTSKITIMPNEAKEVFSQFKNYNGYADLNINLKENIINGDIKFKNFNIVHSKSNIPLFFDNFAVYIKDNNVLINNVAAEIGTLPFYGNITLSNIYKLPTINGYFTSKLTDNFIKKYASEELAKKLTLIGDISLSSSIVGNLKNIEIKPVLTLNQNADIIYQGINLGEINDKRVLEGQLNFKKDEINIKRLDYIKYIASQNNKTFPIIFANLNGNLVKENGTFIPNEINMKTHKNLSARLLNVFLETPIIKQGAFNCDLKFKQDFIKKTAKLLGDFDCKNLDITLFDTSIKNIKINAKNNEILVNLFGFMSDSKISVKSSMENNLLIKPQITSLHIYSDKFDNNKLFEHLAKTHTAMNKNNKIKNLDLSGLSIKNGKLEINELLVKSLTAKNSTSDFSIDENGIFTANNLNIDVGEGHIQGKITYNLNTTEIEGDFKLDNVDSNYVAETLFDGKNQIYGNANGKLYVKTKGLTQEEKIKNLEGYIDFEILDGRMPKLGSLEYLLKAGNIIKGGITSFTLNNVLELLNLVKTGYFSTINGHCTIKNGIADNIEIFSKGDNMSLYIHGNYDISKTHANFEILGKLSKRISTIFGTFGNTSLNTFFRLIPGISLLDFREKDFIENIEKIPTFTTGDYESRAFQAIIDGDINESNYVQSFKWIKD